ncbi:MAG TPA: class I SAM-dependent methyltransferase [Pyrinomonadaceae bacterium]|nr:class I SAM-dependent methyltransferase [Pyrinomonadaceae bacterium]
MSSPGLQQPTPQLFFETANAYQRTEALKAAVDLDVFTALGEGKTTITEIAQRTNASERGIRILCDFLCLMGFLTKDGERYLLTPDAAVFLDKNSPAYLGASLEFLLSPTLTEGFKDLAGAVRKGGTVASAEGTIAPEHPIWVKFARAMSGMMAMPAQLMASLITQNANRKLKILDIAAGHGLYGIAFATKHPETEVVALDWPNVLEVAKENAAKAGVADRYQTKAGSAFDVDYGTGYDLILLTNFLHHFDQPTCENLLRKVHAALASDGRAIILEFVPNEDRISPPETAAFAMVMLGSTPAGDAYTFKELERMCTAAGFTQSEIHQLPPSIQQVVIAQK